MNNNKILVNIVVPSLNERYNLFIPVNKTVTEIIMLVNQAINELTDGIFPIKNNYSLINCETKEILNYDYSINVCNIDYGSTLALI